MNNRTLVKSTIKKMVEVIQKYKLEVLTRYPKDIRIDRRVLLRKAVEGAQFAWVVGHSHTHLTMLGISDEDNDMVNCFCNLGSNDKFFLITIKNGEAKLKEFKNSNDFRLLAKTPISYRKEGVNSNFLLMKNHLKIGTVQVERIGDYQNYLYKATIRPMSYISKLDKIALNNWASNAIIQLSGSLFVKTAVVWEAPYPEQNAA